jgi:hypothetical protein
VGVADAVDGIDHAGGADQLAADRLGAGKADTVEFGTERDAGHIVRPCQTFGEFEDAGEYTGADHRRRETRAFLIGPDDNLDRHQGLSI